MENLFLHTAAFSDYLRNCGKLSHKKVVQPFLSKLLDMAKIFKDECFSKEEELLQDLLSNLISVEEKLSGSNGAKFLASVVSVVENLFGRLFRQVETIRKLEEEKKDLMARISDLGHLVALFHGIYHEEEEEEESLILNSVMKSKNYVHHYKATHADFESPVIVVSWKSKLPGPLFSTEELPLLYVHQQEPLDDLEAVWGKEALRREKKIVDDAVSDVRTARGAIEQNYQALFKDHSNLVAVRAAEAATGGFYIELVVVCKYFVPSADAHPLPRILGGVPTRVTAGTVRLCGPFELEYHRPVLPGAGFAVGRDSVLNLDVRPEEYLQPSVGTIGGFYVSNGVTYGVTCAHCIQMQPNELPLHPEQTPAMQPSAMGMILGAAARQPGLLGEFERMKQLGLHKGMSHLVDRLTESTGGAFCCELTKKAEFGVVQGGVLGALADGGKVVDVALIRLNPEVIWEPHCRPSVLFPPSPRLQLGDGATAPIMPLLSLLCKPAFPVYGRGAVSNDTMEATINPLDTEMYIRNVEPGSLGLVHRCLHASTKVRDWQPGDSGTWCWTGEGMLVGMGIAYASIGGVYYCCILPMEDVLAAIDQVIAASTTDNASSAVTSSAATYQVVSTAFTIF